MSTKPLQPDLVTAPAMPAVEADASAAPIKADGAATLERLIGRVHCYPASLGYEAEFKAIVQAWRPEFGD